MLKIVHVPHAQQHTWTPKQSSSGWRLSSAHSDACPWISVNGASLAPSNLNHPASSPAHVRSHSALNMQCEVIWPGSSTNFTSPGVSSWPAPSHHR